jgi:hypothetical protein
MPEGFVIDRGYYRKKMESVRVERKPEASFWSGLKTKSEAMFIVCAFRCPNCDYLKFYTAKKTSINWI